MSRPAPMSRTGRGQGRVIEPEHDARRARGRATVGLVAAAFIQSARAGDFRPALKEIAAAAQVKPSTVKLHYPRVSNIGAAVAAINPDAILRAVGLQDLAIETMTPSDRRILAHAIAAGERAPWLDKGKERGR